MRSLSGTLAVTAFAAAAVASACTPESTPAAGPTSAPAGTAAATTAPTSNQPLVVGTNLAISSLDPARGFEIAGTIVQKSSYNTLVTQDAADISKVVGDLAERWTVSPDAKTFTFTLKRGVKFHSGNVLTAADVKWSLDRVIGVQGSPAAILDGVDKVEAVDESTVRITTKASDPAFLAKGSNSAFSILDSKTVTAQGGVSGPTGKDADKAEQWLNQNSAGTGPYVRKRWTKEQEVVAERFADYFKGKPSFERVIYRHLPDAAVQKLSLERGDIDVALDLGADQVGALRSNAQVKIVEGRSTDIFFLYLHQDPAISKPLSNPKVAQAMRYAMDYEGFRNLIKGSVTPTSVLPVGILGALGPERAPKRDIAKAKQLLSEAGYPNGLELELEFIATYAALGVRLADLAQKAQADLAAVGIKVTLKPADRQLILTNYRGGKSPFGVWQWAMDYPDPNANLDFLPDGLVAKRSGWTDANSNAEFKQLRQQLLVEGDAAKRTQLWSRAQQLLIDEGPWVPLVQPAVFVGLRSNVDGYVFNPGWLVDPFTMSKK